MQTFQVCADHIIRISFVVKHRLHYRQFFCAGFSCLALFASNGRSNQLEKNAFAELDWHEALPVEMSALFAKRRAKGYFCT